MIDEMVYMNEQAKHAIKELKHKKGAPTVIEYQGRRYVLDMSTPKKTYTKENEEWEKRFYDRD